MSTETPADERAHLLDEAHALEAQAAAIVDPLPPPLPPPSRKTLDAWRKTKPHWLFASACILSGWTKAQRQSVEPLTYTEAEYDAGIQAAGALPMK